jgi:hypothetical protein
MRKVRTSASASLKTKSFSPFTNQVYMKIAILRVINNKNEKAPLEVINFLFLEGWI